MRAWKKLALLFAAAALLLLGYGGAQLLRPMGVPVGTPLDALIPLVPAFVVPYALYFPFILLPWLLLWKRDDEYRMLALCFLATIAVSVAVYVLFQTSGPRATLEARDGFTWLLQQIYGADKNLNAFPSLHTSLSLLTALFVRRMRSRLRWPAAALAALIIASTVLTKQHWLLDVLGGLALAGAVYFAVTRCARGTG